MTSNSQAVFRVLRALAAAHAALITAHVSLATDPAVTLILDDPAYDVVARRTDLGAAASFDPQAHRLIELVAIELGRWTPDDPALDVFAGSFTAGGVFFRLDVVVAGRVNPPGPNEPFGFDPFRYGPHPVYGFVEIDMDNDNTTGGEISAPQFRYLGNVARFGGVPAGETFHDRPATRASDFDGNFLTKPYVERHGEEFHLALLGGQFDDADIEEVQGNGDLTFDADETWVIFGFWFHRAHGFEPFSIAAGGSAPGEYAPLSLLRFSHDSTADRTVVSLVFPLSNGAAAAQQGQSPQPMNHDPSDQASVNEALRDLVISAGIIEMFPTGIPEEALILPWKDKSAGQYLEPTQWRVTALLGTSYTQPGELFVWTDVFPNPTRGDVNGEYGASADDREAITDHIEDHDGDDGIFDDRVVIADFAADFSVYDINHDGQIDATDVSLVSAIGDGDADGDVDLADFAGFQRCAERIDLTGGCVAFDLNANQTVDDDDFTWFWNVVGGPAGP